MRLDITQKNLLNRLISYLPDEKILKEYSSPSSFDLERREVFRSKYPRCDYAAIYHRGKILIIPTWHPLNTVTPVHHGADYGSGVFEGGSAEPVIQDGKLVGANIILLNPKMRRMFDRSLPTRNLKIAVSLKYYIQALIDFITVQGKPLYNGKQGYRRAYIRPVARPAVNLGLKVDIPYTSHIDIAIESLYWPSYLTRDPEDAYHGKGAIAEALAQQRLQPITGKHSSNYGPVGPLTAVAKEKGGDEAILFAPFTSKDGRKDTIVNLHQDYILEDRNVMDVLPDLSLADGPGEEIAVVNEEAKELWILPMRVNRLGGTTLEHIQNHIAPQLGLTVVERTFSINELRAEKDKGNHVCPVFVGNAIRVCPIGQINIRDEKSNLKGSLEFEIPDTVRRMQEMYEAQVSGQVESGNPELLTPINLTEGNAARRELDRLYAAWFEPEYLAEVEQTMAA